MIAKKNRKVDLERKRFAFFQIGLIVSGSLCLAAFEYSTVHLEKKVTQRMEDRQIYIDIEQPIETVYSQPKQQERSSSMRMDEDPVLTKVDLKDGLEVKITNDIIVITPGDGKGDADFKPAEVGEEINPFSQEEPKYPGGLAAMASFINNNINIPEYIQDYTPGGVVYVDFVVNKDGSIEQVVIKQSLSPEIDAAAIKVISKMPRWKPGMNAGKAVRVRYTLPIRLKFE